MGVELWDPGSGEPPPRNRIYNEHTGELEQVKELMWINLDEFMNSFEPPKGFQEYFSAFEVLIQIDQDSQLTQASNNLKLKFTESPNFIWRYTYIYEVFSLDHSYNGETLTIKPTLLNDYKLRYKEEYLRNFFTEEELRAIPMQTIKQILNPGIWKGNAS